MGGEQNADDDDVREAFDMILPSENLHSHIDRHNGEENTFEEPLDEDEEMEDLDYSAIPEMRLGNTIFNVCIVYFDDICIPICIVYQYAPHEKYICLSVRAPSSISTHLFWKNRIIVRPLDQYVPHEKYICL